MNCSPPCFCVHEIFQARVPEWVAVSFSRGSIATISVATFKLWVTDPDMQKKKKKITKLQSTDIYALKRVKVLVIQSYRTLCDPMDCTPPGFLFMEFCRQEHWIGLPFPYPGDLLTQGSNPGLWHCSQILYPLSHQGSPDICADFSK